MRGKGVQWMSSLGAYVVVSALAGCGDSSTDSAPGSTSSTTSTTSSTDSTTTTTDTGGGGAGGGGVFTAPTATTYETSGGTISMPCKGSGALPIVFLAGGSDPANVWSDLVTALGPDVLTCRFNRPGVFPSYDPSDLITPQDVADALAETLPQANIGTRFLLVGHSIGGLSMRMFGAGHGDSVAAAVFLDPTVPSFATSAPAELTQLGFDPQATATEGDAVTSWTSDASLRVLSHDGALAVSNGVFTPTDQAAWDEGQQVYAHLTANGTQTDVTGAGHYVFVDAPEVVVAEIQALLP